MIDAAERIDPAGRQVKLTSGDKLCRVLASGQRLPSAATVNDSKAYLAQLVTRQALNALRAQSRRREDYIGPWLPEPLLLDAKDASTDVVLAESVSMAMLVVLETLTPDERAVFVLREVFGFSHDEIAPANTCNPDASGSSPSTPR
jgi:DNA-directed RNA polymerase specialized sigma24 family protein